MVRQFLKYGSLFLIMTAVFVFGKVMESSLDNLPIQDNINKSLALLEKEGAYPQILFSVPEERYRTAYSQIDTVTEMILLNAAYSVDNSRPLYSAMANFVQGDSSNVQALRQLSEGETLTQATKPQYWWGSLSVLRPALCFFSYGQIREILLIIFLGLLFFIAVWTSKKINLLTAAAFIVGMLSVNLIMIPVQIGTGMVYFVTLIAVAALLCTYPRKNYLFEIMFLSGGCAAYFDWLSTPIAAFAFPAVFSFALIERYHGHIIKERGIKLLCGLSFAWGSAYLLTQMGKWLLSSIVMHSNVFAIASERAVSNNARIVSWGPDTSWGYVVESIKSNFFCLFPFNILEQNYYHITMWLLIGLGSALLIYVLFKKSAIHWKYSFCVFTVGLAPYVWFTVFKAHSYIHHWFTYRSQGATVMALLLAYLSLIDLDKLRSSFGGFFYKLRACTIDGRYLKKVMEYIKKKDR